MISKKNILKFILILLLLGVIIWGGNKHTIISGREKIINIFMPVISFANSMQKRLSGANSKNNIADDKDEHIKTLEFANNELLKENQSLKELLNFKQKTGTPLKSAEVLLYTKELGKETLLIDRGLSDGLKDGDLAIDDKQVFVGFVRELQDNFAQVDIASNMGETFEVETSSLSVRALAEGIGSKTFNIKLIPRETQLHTGDFISLVNGRYKGLLLGEIANIDTGSSAFLEVKAVSLTRPEILQNVFILSSTDNK